ncbi:MAG: low molecular weight phosphotyrosine protein phosphatase [Clostridia bacterium]|nr:low molecular weight phosphotyrosine protein phosphatase [Clostridia bacterium]
MIKVMFVCHGNICRSPAAEYVFAELLRRAGRKDIVVDSAAASTESIGEDLYPPMRRELTIHDVPCPARAARLITAKELAEYDHVLCMDARNLRFLSYIGPVGANVHLLGEYGLGGKEIEDPWYTGRFDRVYEEIALCVRNFWDTLPAEK